MLSQKLLDIKTERFYCMRLYRARSQRWLPSPATEMDAAAKGRYILICRHPEKTPRSEQV